MLGAQSAIATLSASAYNKLLVIAIILVVFLFVNQVGYIRVMMTRAIKPDPLDPLEPSARRRVLEGEMAHWRKASARHPCLPQD